MIELNLVKTRESKPSGESFKMFACIVLSLCLLSRDQSSPEFVTLLVVILFVFSFVDHS